MVKEPEKLKVTLGYVTDETVERGYRKCIAAAGSDVYRLLALELERKGGKCPVCEVPFRERKVASQFGGFSYYEPDCQCFKKCPVCSVPELLDEEGRVIHPAVPRWLVEERLKNLTQCLRCYIPTERKEVRHRSRRSTFDSRKEAASGEYYETLL